jgi:hypothetical protein
MIEMDDMLPEIQWRLKTKTPTCITRYGDGEAIILNGFNDVEKLKMVMKRQIGLIPGIEDAEKIRENLIEAYRKSDIIGIPINKKMNDPESYWVKAARLFEESVGPVSAQITSVDFHSHFLGKGYFDKLLTGLDTLVYVSCRDLDTDLKRRYGIKNVYSYTIQPEMKFSGEYRGRKHWPTQFYEIEKWMPKMPVEGNLCLVGAGVIGKIYNSWFKDLGGISVDVGSVFDEWAGLVTRGPKRGLGVIDNTYKL